jgi:Flp pilus assembly pilin Flp
MNNAGAAHYSSSKPPSHPRRSKQSRGQTLVEYALILAIISVVAIGVLMSLGQQVKGIYSTIGSVVSSAAASH